MKSIRFLVIVFLTIPLFAVTVVGQTGEIKGRVVDDQGIALPFANVLIEGTFMGAATNLDGEYSVANVPPGSYTVRASVVGYRTETAAVTVSADETASRDFTLAEDFLRLEEVVVTGTRIARTKMQASVAISTISPREIELAAPRSTTEVLRRIPGFTRIESSGGEVNQNITVRGILNEQFVAFLEDGMPVFPTMHTFFMNADNLFRMDENIEKIEVVRGGTSSIYGSNAPGAIVNMISKTGGPELGGVVKLNAGTGQFLRYDFNVNGPLGQDWRFNLGGFYRYDRGIRDPGFPGTRGTQLRANVTRLLDNGYVRLSVKYLNDHNQFILPLPFLNPEDPEFVDGFSTKGSFLTLEGNNIEIPLPRDNGELTLPLDDGIFTKGSWLTADFGFDFGDGWSIQNTARVMNVNHEWNALLPFDVLDADAWASERLDKVKPIFARQGIDTTGATYQLLYTNFPDNRGNQVPFATPNNLINPGGQFHVKKPISDFSNQVVLEKSIEKHNLSLGSYFAYYTQKNEWFLTEVLTDIADNPRFVDLLFVGPDTTIEVTKNGFRQFLATYANGTGHVQIFSVFGGAEIHATDRLRIDIGGRYEHNNFVQVSEDIETINLDGDSTTVYDNEKWGDGTFRHFDFSFDEWSASLGINYSFSDRFSVYAAGSRGFKTPSVDEYLFPAIGAAELVEAKHTTMIEGGIKAATPKLGFSVTGFYGELRDNSGQGAVTDPVTKETIFRLLTLPDNSSYGAEVEVSVSPVAGLKLGGQGTFIKTEFKGNSFNFDGTVKDELDGNELPVVPNVLFDLNGSYTKRGFTVAADYHFVGERFSNSINTLLLGNYGVVNAGVSYTLPKQAISFSVNLQNAFQGKGFEEGNPRIDSDLGAANTLFLARPLLPRRWMFSIAYRF